ncbi:MAG: hypothetical protein K5848_04730 [Lachnospiraceae bacterium]|nr:hypothetical protein [Lachnospiraceae bacterium]
MAKKNKKLNDARSMIEYTSRDNGQEFIMKRKMIRAIIIAIITTLALIIFVALYIDATKTIQQTYRSQYKTCIDTVIEDITYYENADGNLDFKYRRLVADMNSVVSFAFLQENFEKEQKSINELYTVFLKYPEQMKEKMAEAKQALTDINAGMSKGYDEADALVDSINLKGN